MEIRLAAAWLFVFTPVMMVGPVSAAEPFPTKPIRIIAGSAPGTLVDQAARLYADKMQGHLKQPVTVENIAGASTLLAVRHVLKAPADGYTVLVSANTLVSVPHINPQAGYAVKEFTAVGEMVRSPMLLVTSSSSPFKSLADLIASAKKSPGTVSYGTSGIGTTNHLGVALLARQAGVSFNHVPYKGITAAAPDIAAGRINFMMGAPNSAAALMQSGALRALAISAEKRSPKFADIPTVKELGFPDAIFEVWIGAVAPATIPRPVRARLGEAMEAARNDQDLLRRLEGLGQEVSAVRTPDQFESVLRADEEKLRKLIRDAIIVPE